MRETLTRLIDWLRRDHLEREMAEEMRFHRQLAERDARAQGMEAGDAVYEAQRRFGNATLAAEAARDRWSLPRVDQLQQDLRYALRGLRRSPGFTTTAVLTLTLGIGANVAMFGVVDQLMFKPFPYLRDPATAHRLYMSQMWRGEQIWGVGDEYTRYLDMRRFTTSFAQLAGIARTEMAIGLGDGTREQPVGLVSGTFWEFFDARPAAGRYFTPAEDEPPRGAEVAVLGFSYWKREFGGRADVIGQRLYVGSIPTTIIGVAPEGFTGVFDPQPAIYLPITLYAGSINYREDRETYYTRYRWQWMNTMVRRKPGVSEAAASADVTQAFRRSFVISNEQEGNTVDLERDRPLGVVGPIKEAAGPGARVESKTALWVTGVAVVVLLIACANVANLTLARASRRQREISVRLALGVSRARLTFQMLTESVLLALIGGAAGLVVAHWGSVAIQRVLTASTDVARPALTDWRMLGMVAGLVICAGLFAGLAPALYAGRGDLAPALRAGARGIAHRSRLRAALLVTQGALSVVLLIGATLFVLSLEHVKRFRVGYDAENVLVVMPNMRGFELDSVARRAMRRDLLARAQATPGVQWAAVGTSLPMWSMSATGFFVPGVDSLNKLGRFTYQVTTPDFFRTFGTRILRGRGFTETDREGSTLVAVVSESMARVLWPGKEPLGQCLRMRRRDAPCTTVVGIAEDIVQQQSQLTDARRYSYYLPMEQFQSQGSTYLLAKMHGDAEAQMEMLRRSVQPVMPGQSYVTVRPMSVILGATQRSWRLGAHLFVVFGVLALVVAAVGLYGVIAYDVSQRMHEMGIRVALGARSRNILGLILGHGTRFAVTGIALGCMIALAASRWVQPLLFQQSARDPIVYIVVGAIMLAVALAACVSPARRAAAADPNAALRTD